MDTEINFFLITFIVFIIILTVYYPISGHKTVKKLKARIASGDNSVKTKFYYGTALWSWGLSIAIIISLIISNASMKAIGIRWIDFNTYSVPKWITYVIVGFYCIHLIFNLYSIVLFKFNEKSRIKAAKSVPNHLKWIFPISKKEKQAWTFTSITAGITEEIMYRGYLFFALKIIFLQLNVIHLLVISTLIFGLGHIYLGKEVIKSTLLGLFFGVYYIVFGSLIPVIIIHIAQDLVLRDMFKSNSKESSDSNAENITKS